MSDRIDNLEKKLDDKLVTNAPLQLPERSRKTLVKCLPYFSLLLGLISLMAVTWLWNWARTNVSQINYVNAITNDLAANTSTKSRFTVIVWLALALLVAECIVYFSSYSSVKARKKRGWDLLFYGALLNIAYGVVIAFTPYGGLWKLIEVLVVSAIGLYLLFQVRKYFVGRVSNVRHSVATEDDNEE